MLCVKSLIILSYKRKKPLGKPVVTRIEEARRGFKIGHHTREMEEFNDFIRDMELLDVPLVCRRGVR